MLNNAGLYIHIPFCIHKCPYCDFYSVSDLQSVPAFADCLVAEIRMKKNQAAGSLVFDSIYIGGGTPTVMDARDISRIMEAVFKAFRIDRHAEITIEANPGTIGQKQLGELRMAGINRINIGVQSFDDATLAFLGRIHEGKDSMNALRMAEKSGFDNIGMDMIYAVPGQSLNNWQNDLERAASFKPAHISCYMLTPEVSTPMDEDRKAGKFNMPPESLQEALFLMTSGILFEYGYEHYEISNFAASLRHRSRHNTKYWNNAPYLGLGPAAHSYLPPQRTANVRSVRRYLRMVKKKTQPVEVCETLTKEQQMIEALYLGLRQSAGVTCRDFNARFKADFFTLFAGLIDHFTQKGLITADETVCRLTEKGMLMHESIAGAFIDRL